MTSVSTVAAPELQAPDISATTYRAAVVREFGSPLVVEQTPMQALAGDRCA
jgi:hypothetical protein